ncbi:hypothetical protein GQ600_14189 [Phytophthora cactorum]|nr:hypothetical protein GQ600_14189 [Phytophthora cactorum]
MALPTEI